MNNVVINELIFVKRGIYEVKTEAGAFLVTENLMVEHHIYKGATIPCTTIKKITQHFDEDVCYESAMRLLSRRDHFKIELKNKLRLREHNDVAIDSVIELLASQGIINENNFALRLVIEKKDMYSKAKIKQYLLSKGCPLGIAENALQSIDGDERKKAYQILSKKARGLNNIHGEKVKLKLFRHLRGKGFSYHDSKWAYQKLLSEQS